MRIVRQTCKRNVQYCAAYVGLARTVYTHRIWRIFGVFPAKNTVYTPYIYNMVLANPKHMYEHTESVVHPM
jgi:hypothetical protein